MADLTITAANVDWVSGPRSTVDAGETIAVGDAIYKSSADSLLYVANVTDPAKDDVVGIALNAATINQPVTYAASGATVGFGAILTATETYVLSATGGIAPVGDLLALDYMTRLGTALTTSNMLLQLYTSSIIKA